MPSEPGPRATSSSSRSKDGARISSKPSRLDPATTVTGHAPPPKTSARETSDRPQRSRRRLVRFVRHLVLAGAIAAALGAIALAVFVRRIEATLPSTAELRRGYRPPQVTRVLAADGAVLAELFTERRTVVKIADLPAHVKLAVLAAEDANFYEHAGLNYLGIARAAWSNLRKGKKGQGASTITQQVVKNLLLDSEKTYSRKIREALLARRLEQELGKDEILELYCNHIYFGAGRYGIEEAARGYFGKHAKDLSLGEAAMIAGIVPAPNAYNPRNDLEAAQRRRSFVLGQMRAKNFVTASEYDAAVVEPVKLAPVAEAGEELAPEVIELVRKMVREVAGEEAARKGGFTVQTTIDPKLQAAARAAVRDGVAAYDKRWKLIGPFPAYPPDGRDPKTKKKLPAQETAFAGVPRYGHGDAYVGVVTGHDDEARSLDVQVGSVNGVVKLEVKDRYDPAGLPPSTWAPKGTRLRVSLLAPPPAALPGDAALAVGEAKVPLRLELGPEAALVAIDVRTRKVLALVGNVEAAMGGLDRATHAHRQPGSTFKPFVYGAAIAAHKITPATVIEATPGDFGGYNPKNSEPFSKDGPVRLRDALAASINLVAVRVAKDVGPQAIIDFARAAGISSTLKPDLAIALGAYEVTPIELAGAYATIAAGGVFEPPIIVTRIIGPDGRELALPSRAPPTRAFGDAEAYVITSLLTSVVEKGTATGARVLGRPIAGKTGTSNQAKDTWFAGFTPDVVTVSWVGYDDARPLGANEFGGRTALPAWVSLMRKVTDGRPRAEFPRPAGIVTVKIDPLTGKLPWLGQEDAIDEIFLQGTEPKEIAEQPAPSTSSSIAVDDPWGLAAPSTSAPPVSSAKPSPAPPLPAPTTSIAPVASP